MNYFALWGHGQARIRREEEQKAADEEQAVQLCCLHVSAVERLKSKWKTE